MNIILGYNINYYKMHVISGTTAANETYTATSLTLTNTLASTNVVMLLKFYAFENLLMHLFFNIYERKFPFTG